MSPYRLAVVVYVCLNRSSREYWNFRQASVYLTEQLALQGFVVMAGDHTDNWGTMFGESQIEDYVIRPQEISRKIDFAETLTWRTWRFAQASLNRDELDDFTLVASPHYDEMWTVQNETNLSDCEFGTLRPTAPFANQGMG